MLIVSQYVTIVHLKLCWRECHSHDPLALPIPVKMQQATAGGCMFGMSRLPLVVPLQQKNCWLSAGFQGYSVMSSFLTSWTVIPVYIRSICQIFSCHLQYWGSNIVQPTFLPLEALQKSRPMAATCSSVLSPRCTCLFLHLYTAESSKKWVCIN